MFFKARIYFGLLFCKVFYCGNAANTFSKDKAQKLRDSGTPFREVLSLVPQSGNPYLKGALSFGSFSLGEQRK